MNTLNLVKMAQRKNRCYRLSFLCCDLISFLEAAEQQEIDKAISQYGEETQKVLGTAQDSLNASFFGAKASQPSIRSENSCQSCSSQSFETLRQFSQQTLKTTAPMASTTTQDLIVFISLGMPEASLKQLAQEAEHVGARLVIQGLVGNSFQQTSTKIQALGLAVDIDPPLFELFEVTRVPTFVRCKTNADGAVKEGHDRLTGNISLLAAVAKFKAFGDLS